jgi:hypothetical protein
MALKSIVDGKVKEENINKLYKRIKSLVRGE